LQSLPSSAREIGKLLRPMPQQLRFQGAVTTEFTATNAGRKPPVRGHAGRSADLVEIGAI
jgi:hypothetical protein